MTTKISHHDLAQFTGSEQFYRHSLMRSINYSEGVHYLAETAGAHWLVDKVATLQLEPEIKREEFQVWKLNVANDAGTLTCEDGNGNVVHSEEITFTDFPLDHIDLWFANGVIYLPSEH